MMDAWKLCWVDALNYHNDHLPRARLFEAGR
jgi:hypothetical protein